MVAQVETIKTSMNNYRRFKANFTVFRENLDFSASAKFYLILVAQSTTKVDLLPKVS